MRVGDRWADPDRPASMCTIVDIEGGVVHYKWDDMSYGGNMEVVDFENLFSDWRYEPAEKQSFNDLIDEYYKVQGG